MSRLSLAAALLAVPAFAETVTEVTAERVEGVSEETSAFYHEADGTEVFAFLTTTPVTVTVTRLDGSDWTAEDLADADLKLATCPAEGPHGLEHAVSGPVLVMTFTCSSLY